MPVRLPPSPTKTKLARAVRRLMDFIPLASVGRVLALEEALRKERQAIYELIGENFQLRRGYRELTSRTADRIALRPCMQAEIRYDGAHLDQYARVRVEFEPIWYHTKLPDRRVMPLPIAAEQALSEAARATGHQYGKQLAEKIIAIANFSAADAQRGRI